MGTIMHELPAARKWRAAGERLSILIRADMIRDALGQEVRCGYSAGGGEPHTRIRFPGGGRRAVRVRRRFRFDAAHRLPRHPGKCRRPHGHSYELVVAVDRPVDEESGLAIDFTDLKRVVAEEVLERLDHTDLNELMENPSAELIAVWIWGRLRDRLPGLSEIELHETRDCSVVYRGE